MRLDAAATFVPLSAPLSIVGGTGASFPSSVIDMLGSGVGTAPQNIIGNATTFGQDIGVGSGVAVPQLQVNVGTAFLTSDSSTLQVWLQAAADQGAAGSYQPSTWTTIAESPAMTAAQLTANTVIARLDWPPDFPANLNPRYLRLLFVTPTGAQFTAGTISFAGFTLARDDNANKFAARNYSVS